MTRAPHTPTAADVDRTTAGLGGSGDSRQPRLADAGVSRRGVVAATGLVGLGVLAGCGGDSQSTDAGSEGTTDGAAKGNGSGGGSGGGAQVAVADVPVGGGTILKEQKVVVTQPKKGEFKAFSAVCTHKGCTVAKVGAGTIDCPCHGSKFSAETGDVEAGPAQRPLEAKAASVQGGNVVVT